MDVNDIYREIYVKPGELAEKIASKYGYLPYMVQRYLYMLGLNDTIKLLEAFEKKLKPVIRVNQLMISPDHLLKRLEDMGFGFEEIKWYEGAYRVVEEPGSPSIGATHEYLKGHYYVHRDAAPLAPAKILLHDYRGEVLDMCAAPGGKATQMAEILERKHVVYANDLVLYRLKALVGHILRMRHWNIRVWWSDARKLPRLINKRFSRVLLDAPCSGEGNIMFDPERKVKTRQLDLARIVKREIELLEAGVELLENDGLLAYVTCSIAPEENEYVVSKVIEHRNDVEVVEPPVKLFEWSWGFTSFGKLVFHSDTRKCIRIWPHVHNMIGMTICLLRKSRS